MKVSELVEQLRAFDQSLEVKILIGQNLCKPFTLEEFTEPKLSIRQIYYVGPTHKTINYLDISGINIE